MKSLFVLASSLATASALPTRFKSGLDTNLESVKSSHDYYLDQKIDHFDRSNKEVFGQRYFVNDTYWNGDGPVFLCVGGEGPPMNWKVLVASDHCNDMVELAPQVGALLLAIEHRYYGPSTPNDDYSSENLRFLSSEQALGDIAHFHSKMTADFDLKESNKWVSFGGSYPGMMAAMARLRYPHLFHAAVSSSSPLQAAVEMAGYNEVVAASMANEGVGGSQQCLDVITEGHKAVGDLLLTEAGRRELETKFNICTPFALDNEANAEQFAGDGVVYLPVQSNDPTCKGPHCNIEKICELMTDSSVGTPLDRLISLHLDQSGGACTPANHELYLRAISNPKDSGRSWYYQTCTEWGYYMTCPVGSTCPYVQGLHKLSSDYEMCSRAFSIDKTTVDESITFANDMYGGSHIQATRILYPNGEIDPWKANGVLVPPNDQSPVMMVTGASHHVWTHAAEPTDSEYVVAAKQAIWDQVIAWLKEA